MSKSEVTGFLISAIRYTAGKVGVSDTDWKAPRELLDEIKSLNPEIHKLLDEFISAYVSCYKSWTPANITRRDNARNAILAKLKTV